MLRWRQDTSRAAEQRAKLSLRALLWALEGGIYQHMIAAYRERDRKRGRELMQQVIGAISRSMPTEVINGRIEHLRGSALGFRNLTD